MSHHIRRYFSNVSSLAHLPSLAPALAPPLALALALSLIAGSVSAQKADPSSSNASKSIAEAFSQKPDYFYQPDFFNPRLTDEQKANPKPVKGGEIVVRVPVDEGDLNPLTTRSAGAQNILGYSALDSMIAQDPETYEYVPWLVDWWQSQDVIKMADGSEIVGHITELEGKLLAPERVAIQPGAALVTVGKHDVDEEKTEIVSDGESTIVMKDGRVYHGAVEELIYTYRIITRGEGDVVEVDLDKVLVLEEESESGGEPTMRPAINKQCRWKLHLREGPTWQDGEPLKPEDVTLTFKVIKNTYVKCQSLRNYYNRIESIEHIGDRVLQYELNRPYSLSYRWVASGYVLPSHLIDFASYEGDDQAFGEYFNEHPMYKPGDKPLVGLGAYRLTQWVDSRVVLERWDDWWVTKAGLPYWEEGAPYLDRIIFRTISSNTAALNELKDGGIGADFDIEPAVWNQEDTQTEEFTKNIVRVKIVTPTFVYIGWNEKNPIFADKRVRQALSMMIPRERILNEIHEGMGRVVTGPYFIDGPIYDHSLEPYDYDPQAARRILRRLGWSDRDNDGVLDNKDGEKFEFTYLIHNARAYHQKVAEIIKEEMGKNGILMNIDRMEWAIFYERVIKQSFDAVRFAWQLNGFDDPDNYQIYHSSQAMEGGSNTIGFKNAEVDELLEAIRYEFDYTKRMEMNRRLHGIFHEEQPYAYLFAFDEPYFYNTKFRNVRFWTSPPGYDLRSWYVDPDYKPAE